MSFDAVYLGMSGLATFNQGLNVISQNVMNLNTAGYKGQTLQFADLMWQTPDDRAPGSEGSMGNGVTMRPPLVNFSDGTSQITSQPLDVAITGRGFFVARKDGMTRYTRDGHFHLDGDGVLMNADGARVSALGSDGLLHDVTMADLQTFPAKATANVAFQNNLLPSQTTPVNVSVSVIDPTGATRVLKMTVTKAPDATPPVPGVHWTVSLDDGVTNVASFKLDYDASGANPSVDGIPMQTSKSVTYAWSAGQTIPITLEFAGTSSLTPTVGSGTGTSTFATKSQDGLGAGTPTGEALDTDGFLVVTYSNGQTKKGPQLAIATFDDLTTLKQVGGSAFRVDDDSTARLSVPKASLQASALEGSNVDLSTEFSRLITVERAYQSASRVVTTASDMLDTLIKGDR